MSALIAAKDVAHDANIRAITRRRHPVSSFRLCMNAIMPQCYFSLVHSETGFFLLSKGAVKVGHLKLEKALGFRGI